MAWTDIAADPTFQALPDEKKSQVKFNYFQKEIQPNVPADKLDQVRANFLGPISPIAIEPLQVSSAGYTGPTLPPSKMQVGEEETSKQALAALREPLIKTGKFGMALANAYIQGPMAYAIGRPDLAKQYLADLEKAGNEAPLEEIGNALAVASLAYGGFVAMKAAPELLKNTRIANVLYRLRNRERGMAPFWPDEELYKIYVAAPREVKSQMLKPTYAGDQLKRILAEKGSLASGIVRGTTVTPPVIKVPPPEPMLALAVAPSQVPARPIVQVPPRISAAPAIGIPVAIPPPIVPVAKQAEVKLPEVPVEVPPVVMPPERPVEAPPVKAEAMGKPPGLVPEPKLPAVTYKAEPAIKTLRAIAPKRTTLPILSQVMVRNGMATTTDLEVGFSKKTDLPDGMYQIIGNNLEKSELSPEDFPVLPKGKDVIGNVNRNEFIKEFERASRSVSKEEARYALTGVLLDVKEGKGRLVAMDGRRLSVNEIELKNFRDGKYLIGNSDKVLTGLKGLAGDKLTVRTDLKEKEEPTSLTFEGADGRVSARLIKGNFPAYEQVIPKPTQQLSVDVKSMSDTIKVLMPYAKTEMGSPSIAMNIKPGKVVLSAGKEHKKAIEIPAVLKQTEYGPITQGTIMMPIRGEGDLNFPISHLSDALSGIRGKTAYFGLKEAVNPVHIYGRDLAKPRVPAPAPPGEVIEKEIEPAGIQGYMPAEVPSSLKVPIEEPPEIIKQSEIAAYLSEALDVPIRRGHFREKAWGIYKPTPDIIRIKRGKFDTISHEVGHYLDDNIPEIKELRKRKRELINLTRGFPKHKQTSAEGIAEFIRLYLTDRTAAAEQAPRYFADFERILTEKYPGTKDILDVASKQYAQWQSMPAVAKVKSQISFNPEKPRRFNFHDFYSTVIDDLHPLKQYTDLARQRGIQLPAEDDPYILSRLFRGWVGKANHFLERKTFDPITLEITGKSYKEITAPIDAKNVMDDWDVYQVARRKVKRPSLEMGIPLEDAQQAVTDLDAKFPEFRKIADEIYGWRKRLREYLMKSGVISKELNAKIEDLQEDYAPFYRVWDAMQRKGYGGKTFANISNPIKRIKGSEREIISPTESDIKNAYTFINSAERNQVGIALINLSRLNPELGRLVEEVPGAMAKVANVSAAEMFTEAEIREMGLLGVSQDILEKTIDIFRPSMFNPKDNILAVLVEGKKRFFQVEPALYRALLALDHEDLGLLVKILSYPARALRAGATLSPEFLGRNPFRDQLTAYIFSQYGYKPFLDIWGGLAATIGKTDDYWLWMRAGGAHSMLVSMDRTYIKQNLKEIFRGKSLRNPLEALRALAEFGEQGTRLGEFKKGIHKFKVTPREAAFASREVTLDFSRIGSKAKIANSIITFFNANVQGTDKVVRVFKENPKRTMLRVLISIVLPSVYLYFMNRKDKRYQQLPRWQRDYFWPIFVGPKVPPILIPKPFELGVLFGSGTERFLGWLDARDPKSFDKFGENLLYGFLPGFLPTAMKPVIENITNYDFFKGRPIESERMRRYIPEERYQTYTPSLMRWVGKYTSQIGLSPLQLEHLVRGYFGGLGGLVMGAPDLAMKIAGKHDLPLKVQDIPLIRGFVARDPYGTSSESVNSFYNDYENSMQYYTTFKEFHKKGERDKAAALLKEHPELVLFPAYEKRAEELAVYRRLQESVYNSKLPPKEKFEKIQWRNREITRTQIIFNKRLAGWQRKPSAPITLPK